MSIDPARRKESTLCAEPSTAASSAASPPALATFFGLNVTYVRIAFVALTILGGAGGPLYLAAWALIPEQDTDIVLAETALYRVAGHFS